jgi:hypothetical protein
MAEYFLKHSPTYCQQTSQQIYRRREVVCKYLNDKYKSAKGNDDEMYQAIVGELAPEGIALSKSGYQNDKSLIRATYVWLIASLEEKQAFAAEKSGNLKTGINCFIKDGITTWEGWLVPEKLDEPVEAEQPVIEETAAIELQQPPSAKQEIFGMFADLAERVEALLLQNEELLAANDRLREEHQTLQRRAETAEAYNALQEEELERLERALVATKEALRKADTATLEEIAVRYADIPKFFEVISDMKQYKSKREQRIEKLLTQLPKTFSWLNDSGVIHYHQHFLDALIGLEKTEQERVMQQLLLFSTQGAEHASLHTRKPEMRLLNSPVGCLVSRAAGELRFTWKKNGTITVFWLFRKGDSRVGYSES